MFFQLWSLFSIWILLFACRAESIKPSLNIAVKSSDLSVIKNVWIKEISDKLKEIPLPDFKASFLLNKITGKNVKAQIIPFSESQIEISLIDGTNDIRIEGKGLNMNATMDLISEFLFISHNCKGSVKMSSTGFTARIELLQNGGQFKINIKELKISTTRSHFSIKLTGNFLTRVLNFLLQCIHFIFFSFITNSVDSAIKEMTAKVINDALSNHSYDIELFKWRSTSVFAKFIVAFVNQTKNGYMPISLFVYAHKKTNKNPPKELPNDLPVSNGTCNGAHQIFLSDYILKTILNTSYEEGLLKFEYKMKVLTIDIELGCRLTSLPSMELKSDIEVKGKTNCLGKITSKKLPLDVAFSFEADGFSKIGQHIKDAKFYLEIEELRVENLRLIKGEDIDEKKLKDMITSLAKDFKDEVNESIAKNGISLPIVKYLDFSAIREYIIKDHIYICGSLNTRKGYIQAKNE